MTYRDKLENAWQQSNSLLCVGLDPQPELMPEGFGEDDVARFNIAIIEATGDLVCAYKPNVAFYEALGPERGYAALRETLAAIPSHIIKLADAKRGDVEHTARAYVRAFFDDLGFDAVTVSPYLGGDSVAPWLEREDVQACLVYARRVVGHRHEQVRAHQPVGLGVHGLRLLDDHEVERRPGAAEKNGYGYEDLKKVNPKLIYASLTDFGQDGPWRDRLRSGHGEVETQLREPLRPADPAQPEVRRLGGRLLVVSKVGSDHGVVSQVPERGAQNQRMIHGCFERFEWPDRMLFLLQGLPPAASRPWR